MRYAYGDDFHPLCWGLGLSGLKNKETNRRRMPGDGAAESHQSPPFFFCRRPGAKGAFDPWRSC
jgi:hypothetical protein